MQNMDNWKQGGWGLKRDLVRIPIKFINNGSTDISETSFEGQEKFIISPNPASDYIEIYPPFSPFIKGDAEGRGISEIKIYNTLGECVIDLTPTPLLRGEGLRINISNLPIGLFFIQIGNYSQKFMVVK